MEDGIDGRHRAVDLHALAAAGVGRDGAVADREAAPEAIALADAAGCIGGVADDQAVDQLDGDVGVALVADAASAPGVLGELDAVALDTAAD